MKSFFGKLSGLLLALSIIALPSLAVAQSTFRLPSLKGNAGKVLEVDSNEINVIWGTGGGGGGGTVTSITAQNSITATPNPIIGAGTINLVNDATAPGNFKYYGTDGSGTKGFFDISSAIGDCPNALNTEVLYSDGTNCIGDADFTFNATNNALEIDGIKIYSPTTRSTVVGGPLSYPASTGIDNTGFGYNALKSISTGTQNTVIGSSNGNITTGGQNTFIGYAAGNTVTTQADNVYVGAGAGSGSTTGQGVFVGVNTGANNNGIENTFIGYQAGVANDTGGANTFLGYSVGEGNVTGSENLFAGTYAGQLGDGTWNVYLGHQAGQGQINNNATENVFIGHLAGLAIDSNGDGNVGIGANVFQTLSSGAGNVSVGYNSGLQLTSEVNNVFIGGGAGGNAQSNANTLIGHSAGGQLTTVGGEVYIGFEAGGSNQDVDENVFIGYQSGTNVSAGVEGGNTFVGYQSGLNASTSENNTFIGNRAGLAFDTGVNNTFLGALAGSSTGSAYSDNTFIGYGAGLTTEGEQNTFLGSQAGQEVTTGTGNLFIGYSAGGAITTESANLFIGNNSSGFANVDNAIVLGHNLQALQDNFFVVGSEGGISDTWIGTGQYTDGSGNSSMVLHASGAEPTAVDLGGKWLGVAGGKGNGLGDPGSFFVQTSVPDPAGTGATEQILGDRERFGGRYVTMIDSTATTFAMVTIPDQLYSRTLGGELDVTFMADDGTDQQVHHQKFTWQAINTGGAIQATLTAINPGQPPLVSGGTLSCAVGVTAGAGTLEFQGTCLSDLGSDIVIAQSYITKNFGEGIFDN